MLFARAWVCMRVRCVRARARARARVCVCVLSVCVRVCVCVCVCVCAECVCVCWVYAVNVLGDLWDWLKTASGCQWDGFFLSCWCYSSQASSQEPQSPPPPLPPRISLRQVDTPVRDSSLLADAGQCMHAAYSHRLSDVMNKQRWLHKHFKMNHRRARPIISSVSDGMNKLLKWIVERIDPLLVLLVMVWTSSACFILFYKRIIEGMDSGVVFEWWCEQAVPISSTFWKES